jgi:hypothetical protein
VNERRVGRQEESCLQKYKIRNNRKTTLTRLFILALVLQACYSLRLPASLPVAKWTVKDKLARLSLGA